MRSGVKTLVAQDLGDSGPVIFRDLGIPFGVQTPQSYRREMNETRVKGLKDYLLQTFTRRHYEVLAYYMADIIIAPDQRKKVAFAWLPNALQPYSASFKPPNP